MPIADMRPRLAAVTPLIRSRRSRPFLGVLGFFHCVFENFKIAHSRSRLSIQRIPRSRGPVSWEGSVYEFSPDEVAAHYFVCRFLIPYFHKGFSA